MGIRVCAVTNDRNRRKYFAASNHGAACTTSKVLLAALPMLLFGGCGASSRSGATPPRVDPATAAAEAVERMDSDGDSHVSPLEAVASPAIASEFRRYDVNGDGQLSADEIESRITELFSRAVGLLKVECTVTRRGRPLTGAEVRFIPESFLGDSLTAATATTDDKGFCSPSIPQDKLPASVGHLQMMQPGIYRVEISHPSITGEPEALGFDVDPTRRDGTAARFDL